jgi:hypothetical protein
MGVQQSAQPASQLHQPQKRPRWLSVIIIVACVLTVLSFIGATIFWIGLLHDKLSDTLGAIFTALGTIFGFIALVLAIPPFIQYLRERRSVSPPISAAANTKNKDNQSQFPTQSPTPNSIIIDSTKVQGYSPSAARPSSNSQQPSLFNQHLQAMNQPALNIPTKLRALSPREKEQLVDTLLACRTMRDRNSRNQVVQELSFADSIDRDSNTTNKDDVMNIVNRCLDFSEGLQQLVERIEYREENSLPMEQLRIFVSSLT